METHEIMMTVYEAMREKGYDAVTQIAAYLIVGDPSYITSYKNARGLLLKIDRYELIQELLKAYLEKIGQEQQKQMEVTL